jgi:hypothetical protein
MATRLTDIRKLAGGNSHQDRTDNENDGADLQGPFSSHTLCKQEAEDGTKESPSLESRCDVARDAVGCTARDVKVSLEAISCDCRSDEGRVVAKTVMREA